jgi:hypothetical protein
MGWEQNAKSKVLQFSDVHKKQTHDSISDATDKPRTDTEAE